MNVRLTTDHYSLLTCLIHALPRSHQERVIFFEQNLNEIYLNKIDLNKIIQIGFYLNEVTLFC